MLRVLPHMLKKFYRNKRALSNDTIQNTIILKQFVLMGHYRNTNKKHSLP